MKKLAKHVADDIAALVASYSLAQGFADTLAAAAAGGGDAERMEAALRRYRVWRDQADAALIELDERFGIALPQLAEARERLARHRDEAPAAAGRQEQRVECVL